MIDFFSTTPMAAGQIEARRNEHPESCRIGWTRLFEVARWLGYPDATAARAADVWAARGSVTLRRIPETVGWRGSVPRWTERLTPELAGEIAEDLT